MGPIEKIVTDKLAAEFKAEVLQVTNESYMHSVPAGSETHFKVVLVTEQFAGKRQVQRHQAIYTVLAEELAGPIHALALHTFSGAEWAGSQGQAPDSPQCRGANKSD
ncbi:BolA/IbaG family iron-sulfur metabolism protein [SAR92 clade bacterium H455]|uniref:BolA/IbaG family iron-sulfur metabolism protein n=1 Tax=SAR92 clade bacterium H455 TaxID=2974818 RepID=A0ABY5TLL1_9GAMM|nr:BolA/IbaG family iron-sulfur metabolism protein [SAR92 clade bacterium H455]